MPCPHHDDCIGYPACQDEKRPRSERILCIVRMTDTISVSDGVGMNYVFPVTGPVDVEILRPN